MFRSDQSRGSVLGRTCLFIECTDGAILLVNNNTSLVHEARLFGIIARQVNGGKSRLCGLGGSGSGSGNSGHWSEKERKWLKVGQTGLEASSIYAGPLESADTTSFSLFSHGFSFNSQYGNSDMRLVRTHSHHSEHCLHQSGGRVNRNFGHSSSSTGKKRMTHITSARLLM